MDVLQLLIYFVIFVIACAIIWVITGMQGMPPFARPAGYVLMLVVLLVILLHFAGGSSILHTPVAGLIPLLAFHRRN